MEKTLLIGNGLNRTLENSIAWNNLLEKIAQKYDIDYSPMMTFPLDFESIINQIFEKGNYDSDKLYSDVKKDIAKMLSDVKLPENSIHEKIKSLKINNIMTTNYDYLLEYVYDKDFQYKGSLSGKYRFDRIAQNCGVNFYHVHGFIDNPKTICLGYEHYVGISQRLRQEINKGAKNQKNIVEIIKNHLKPNNTWGEKFFTSDIAIIGLSLDQCETDLWWLITYRAMLYYSNLYSNDNFMKNNIVYYDIINDRNELFDKNFDNKIYKEKSSRNKKYILLESEHVIVKTVFLSNCSYSYQRAYEIILNDIKENGIGGKTQCLK